MGFLSFLWNRKHRLQRHIRTARPGSQISRLRRDMDSMQAQISVINTKLSCHENQLADQALLIDKQSKRLDSLEVILHNQPPRLQMIDSSHTNRPIESTNPAQADMQSAKIEVSTFSPQEKRILSVFFDHRDMALSYADIAQTLGKSPNTVKNQMNQMGIKADLFDITLDNDSRKRFRFKKGLSIEKYLNVSRPAQPRLQFD